MKILGISGSIRKSSFNTMLLKNIKQVLPDGASIQIHDLSDIALYNEDIDNDKQRPKPVTKLIKNIKEADAVIFASPEYNHGMSGVMKNAIDWASRPAYKSSLLNKKCTILTAGTGAVGGARAQQDLKVVLLGTASEVYPSVEFLLPEAQKKFDENGILTDETAKRRLERHITGFIEWSNANRNS